MPWVDITEDVGSAADTGQSGGDFLTRATKFFVDKGYSPNQAAGIAGNLYHESGGRTDILHDGGAGIGLAGWNGDRRRNLMQFAGDNYLDETKQLEFVDYELRNHEIGAYKALQKANTPEQAAQIFSKLYERPGNPMMANRIKYSQEAITGYSMEQARNMTAGPAAKGRWVDVTDQPQPVIQKDSGKPAGKWVDITSQAAQEFQPICDGAENCGDAVALSMNPYLKFSKLPRGGLDESSIKKVAQDYNAPVYSKPDISLESLTKLGPGTIIRMTRRPGDKNYEYGETHAETLAIDPETGRLAVASFTPGKGLRYKKLSESYVHSLPKQTIATNLLTSAAKNLVAPENLEFDPGDIPQPEPKPEAQFQMAGNLQAQGNAAAGKRKGFALPDPIGDELRSQVMAGAPEAMDLPEVQRKTNMFVTGVLGTAEGMAGAGEWAGYVTGIGGGMAKQMGDQIREWNKSITPEDLTFADKVAAGFGSMATFFIPGFGVGMGVNALKYAPKLASWLGAGTMAVTEAMTEAGGVWRDAKIDGKSDAEANNAASWTFALNLPLLAVTDKLGFFGEGRKFVKKVLTPMLTEGAQEMGQEVISNWSGGKDIKLKEVLEAGAIGAIIGGGTGAVLPGEHGKAKETETDTTTEESPNWWDAEKPQADQDKAAPPDLVQVKTDLTMQQPQAEQALETAPVRQAETAPPVPEVPPAVEAKEPWQMTKEEISKGDLFIDSANDHKMTFKDIWGPTDESAWGSMHRQSILQAINEGKPIPPKVLADYSDLAKQPLVVRKGSWGRISEQSAAEINRLRPEFNTKDSYAVITEETKPHIDNSRKGQLTAADAYYFQKAIEEPTEILPNIGTTDAPHREKSVLMVHSKDKNHIAIVEMTPGDKDNVIWNLMKITGKSAENYLDKFRQEKTRLLNLEGRSVPSYSSQPDKIEAGIPEDLAGGQVEQPSNENITTPEQKSKPGSDTNAFAPQADFRRSPQDISRQAEGEPIGRKDMADFLRQKLDVPIRTGRFFGGGRKSGVMGLWFNKKEVIRSKMANDIETISHEAFHGLHKWLWPEARTKNGGLSAKVFRKTYGVTAPMQKELVHLAYPGAKGKLLEGFAEFGRLYITNPAEAQKRAPLFHDYFENLLDQKAPEAKEIFLESRAQFDKWLKQSPEQRIKGQISQGEPSKKPKLTVSRIYTALVDALHPIKKAVDAMTGGKEISPSKDPYTLLRLLPGWTGKADTFLQYRTFDFNTMKWKGKSIKEILAPVAKRLDDFQVYIVAKRANELHRRGKETGILPGDAKAVIKKYEQEFGQVFEELKQFQDDTLTYLRDAGLLSEETYAGIKSLNQDYVPFYRLIDDMEGGSLGTKGYESRNPIKRIKGSWLNIIDPLESIIKNTYSYINLAEKNAALQALIDLSDSVEGAGKWVEQIPAKQALVANVKLSDVLTAEDIENIPEDDPIFEKVIKIFKPSMFAPKGNVITVYKSGKPQYYEVDPEIFRTIKGLDKSGMEVLTKMLGRHLTKALMAPARLLRAGATLTPEFLARNPVRDQWSAYIYSKYGFKPGLDLLRGIARVIKRDDLYWSWKKAGGEQAALVSMDREYLQKNLSEVLSENSVKDLGKYFVRHPLEALRILSEFGEEGSRMGEFLKGIKKEGMTKEGLQKAAMASRELTLDFARAGAKGKVINALTAFWNANIQGTDKMIRQFKEKPGQTTARLISSITIPSIILAAINSQDDRWKDIPRWQKDLFWIVMTKNHVWRIPKPFELGILFGTIPERFVEWAIKKDKHAFDDLIKTVGRGFSPGLLPTAVLPAMENWGNWSTFFDRPIVSMGKENLPPEYQYGPYTSELTKAAGKAISKVPGLGDTGFASPAKIEHAVRGYTGGLGGIALQIGDSALRRILDRPPRPEWTIADVPGIKGFVTRHPTTNTDAIRNFYDAYSQASKIRQAMNLSLKKGMKDEYEKLISEGKKYGIYIGDDGKAKLAFQDSFASMKKIRDAMNVIEDSKTMDPKAKRERLDFLTKQMNKVAKQGNQAIERFQSRLSSGTK